MKAKHIGDRYANFDDGTCWPIPEMNDDYHSRVAWALRYGVQLDKSELIYASDVICAYEALIAQTQKRRQEIVSAIRQAVDERDGRAAMREKVTP